MEKVLVHITELRNQTNQEIEFEVENWYFHLRALPPGKKRHVKLWKVLQACRKHNNPKWKIRFMMNKEFSGLEINAYLLSYYARIIIKLESVGEGTPYLPYLEAIPEKSIDHWLRLKYIGCPRDRYWDNRPSCRIRPDPTWAKNLRENKVISLHMNDEKRIFSSLPAAAEHGPPKREKIRMSPDSCVEELERGSGGNMPELLHQKKDDDLRSSIKSSRVMNALIQKVAARKQQKASSDAASKGKAVAAEVSTEEVTMVTVTDAREAPQSASSWKRRAPGTSSPVGQSGSSGELGPLQTDVVPLRQFRPDSRSKVIRWRSNLNDMYRNDIRIIGTGPTSLAGAVLWDVVSEADPNFLRELNWSELVSRSTSASAEAALLNAEVAFRATNFRKEYSKDARAFQTTSFELDKKLADLTETLEKEKANSKRREDDMRQGFAAETMKLKNELRGMEVRLEASHEEIRASQEVARAAQGDLKKGSVVFKEAFLKSKEFALTVAERALDFIYVGFDGVVAQFREAGYPPEGFSADFLDAQKVVDNLPQRHQKTN
ncbi:uncharacterized protein [Primulina eburnea]|uniref:uncharacterized protein n=1 Tax=Primulina eburnea TaxID=1245227 RepID=UPI003C6C5B07